MEPVLPCCLAPIVARPRCSHLRVAVLAPTPYTLATGVEVPDTVTDGVSANQSPVFRITAGLPGCARITGAPSAQPSTARLPRGLVARFGRPAAVLEFDFSSSGVGTCAASGAASGVLFAASRFNAGRNAASLGFVYRWCGPQVDADGNLLPVFTTTTENTTSSGLRFVVRDDTSYVSESCDEASVVVLALEQHCADDAVIVPLPRPACAAAWSSAQQRCALAQQ